MRATGSGASGSNDNTVRTHAGQGGVIGPAAPARSLRAPESRPSVRDVETLEDERLPGLATCPRRNLAQRNSHRTRVALDIPQNQQLALFAAAGFAMLGGEPIHAKPHLGPVATMQVDGHDSPDTLCDDRTVVLLPLGALQKRFQFFPAGLGFDSVSSSSGSSGTGSPGAIFEPPCPASGCACARKDAVETSAATIHESRLSWGAWPAMPPAPYATMHGHVHASTSEQTFSILAAERIPAPKLDRPLKAASR